MSGLAGILAQLLHLALMLALAPLLAGLLRWLRARLQGRRGAPPWQAWRDLMKLLRKQPVLAEHASPVTPIAPHAALAATLLAAALVPGFARGMALGGMADLLLLAGLLAIARLALALAAMDAGTAQGSLGAAREAGLARFAEPAFLLCVMAFAILTGGTNLDATGRALQEGALAFRLPLALALAALLAVGLAANGRLPTDDPEGLSEPASGQGAMRLEASGRHLALWQMQAALRLLLWLSLLAALFLPFGTAAADDGPLAWASGLLAWLAKLGLLALALGLAEALLARLPPRRLPELLGLALLLALLGLVFLLLATGLA
ncbi:NADH-quinone oxidoreductase subunit H [Pseudoroseomonas cervicalis]|uniref:NADH-quinone oxidoreductase subunit H n=1 Tax=Teichococcus cervicalis TaxID=204525 RepID=UPI0022F1875D|nr:NADH-quinone oxidoreductase subunit H [Pseudoroseomonas cervicalis]WBV43957.1 NADH-quinone oxidoreductase subunit H [Pseudoroseomonas cervicalis]